MRKLIAIMRKDLKVRFSSKAEWLFSLFLPILFIVIVTFASGTFASGAAVVPVVDEANTPLSASLIAELRKVDTITVELAAREGALRRFENRGVEAVIIIPAGFGAQTAAGQTLSIDFYRQPNSVAALNIDQVVQLALRRVGGVLQSANIALAQAEAIQPFASEAERATYFADALSRAQTLLQSAPQRVQTDESQVAVDTVVYDPAANSAAGQIITWVFIPLLGISAMMAQERGLGTLDRLFTTPTSKATYLFGTVLGQVLIALAQMAVLIGFSALVFKVSWGQSPGAVVAILVTFALAAAAMGVFLGGLIRSEAQASGLSTMISMVMALLGGAWFPQELFPNGIRQVMAWLPTSQAMNAMKGILIQGKGLAAVWPNALVLLAYAVIFFAIGIPLFRRAIKA